MDEILTTVTIALGDARSSTAKPPMQITMARSLSTRSSPP
jgi:hypothetical protein